ncbi:MAG: hypothetical protein M1142_03675 [Patescibacteria group bacterium]|nr:hypothetical protein [Patescibacteria group bacterium]
MAVKDSKLFKGYLEGINYFHKYPQKSSVRISDGKIIWKKPMLKVLRFILIPYRKFTEDEEFIKQLYLNQNRDLTLKHLLLKPEPIIPEPMHETFAATTQLPENQQEQAQNQWVEKLIGTQEKEPPSPPISKTENLPQEQSASQLAEQKPTAPAQPAVSPTPAVTPMVTVAASLPVTTPSPPLPQQAQTQPAAVIKTVESATKEAVTNAAKDLGVEAGIKVQRFTRLAPSKMLSSLVNTIKSAFGQKPSSSPAPSTPSSTAQPNYVMKNGIPHLQNASGRLVPTMSGAAVAVSTWEDFQPFKGLATNQTTPSQSFLGNLPKAAGNLFKNIGRSTPIQNAVSGVLIRTQKIIYRYATPEVVGSLVTGTIGGILGYSATHTVQGAGIGAAVGGSAVPAIKSRLGKAALKAAGKGALKAAQLGSGPVGWATLLLDSKTIYTLVKWAMYAVFFLIFGIPIFIMINKSSSLVGPGSKLFGGFSTPSSGPYIPGSDNINSCKFTYQGKQFSIPSNTLRSLMTEVSAKTGVPASVLAGVAMHESNDFTSNAQDSHDAFFNRNFNGVDCYPHFPTSPTGALGLMQIQTPPNLKPQKAPDYNPAAVDLDGIKTGLGFLGRDLSTLKTSDYCDIKTNLYLGAGVLISKNGGKAPTTAEEVKSSVCAYYGSCTYGSYNYGEEVANDFNSCSSFSTPQLSPPAGDLRLAIQNQFGIAFDNSSGFNNGVLSWAWEALVRANAATNFFPLLRQKGLINITLISTVGHTGGNTVSLSSSVLASKDLFEQNLIHELGHIIHGTRGNATYSTQQAVAQDGSYISGYAQGATADPSVACNSANSGETQVQLDEDFAESVSYYINTKIHEQNYSKNNACPPRLKNINPFASGKYPAHLRYIKSVLGGNNF